VTTTRWLSQDEQRTWRAFLAASELLGDALDAQLRRDAGMPHAYYIVLAMLSEAPRRRMRMSELATLAHSSQSRLSHAVARLEERGWVRRERTAEDRRGNVAVLTDKGYEVLAATAPQHVEAVRQNLFDLLSPEQITVLGEACEAMLRKLGPTRMDLLLRGT
jgi:DNA-binding MarR family transcriptional regulator